MLTDSDSMLLVMIWVENCWSKFWCYSIKLSEFKQWLVLYQTFWVQVLLKFLISDDELNKKLIKNNAFMFFDSDFIEISDFKSRFFFRNFWFLLSFLSLSSDFTVKISGFNFWFELCSLFLYRLHVDSKINELWTNVMSLYKVNHMSVL